MPFVFPRRVLRKKDILVPKEMNADFQPVRDLLSSGVDRHNFCGSRLKANLEPDASIHSTSEGDSDVRGVARSAYHRVHTKSVESFYYMDRTAGTGTTNQLRSPPNFVRPDGVTFRDARTGFSSDGHPFVVPHTGEWAAVKGGDLSDTLKLEFTTTGTSSLWLCAQLQYIWQGFFELKLPWIGSASGKNVIDAFTGKLVPMSDAGWSAVFHADELARREAEVLNAFGPQESWVSYSSPDLTITDTSEPRTTSEFYAFPLNELAAKYERTFPNLGGQHHISQGFYPSLVQFALRVDGKIIEETITGKDHSFEESAHGLQISDSPIEEFSKGYYKRRAQRMNSGNASYGSYKALGTAGQKLPSTRATSCGPEVMPVRIGAVVPLSAGAHTVEIVARRLDRKKGAFSAGDFVGVFSRRLTGIEMPILSGTSDISGTSSDVGLTSDQMAARYHSYETEDVLHKSRVVLDKTLARDELNSLRGDQIKRHSLPNTHLPTKASFVKTVTLTGSFTRNANNNLWDPHVGVDAVSPTTQARFPGFKNTDYINDLVPTFGGVPEGWSASTYERGAGWQKIRGFDQFATSAAAKELSISSAQLETSNANSLILMADIELKWIRGLLSAKAQAMFDTGVSASQLNTYTSYLQDGKYLDLFALFAIGYRVGSDPASGWTIASETTPVMVNSFAWANRSGNYSCDRTIGDVELHSAAYGTGGVEYSFSVSTRPVDRRGGNTFPSNIGCNIPLMLVIDGKAKQITEVAVFASTTFPDIWSDDTALYGDNYSSEARKKWSAAASAGLPVHDIWASPVFGRGILKGVEVCWGNCSLSAIKLNR